MSIVVMAFGVLLLVLGAMILIQPRTVFGPMGRSQDRLALHLVAIAARLLLGVALVMCAEASKYPMTLLVLGWLTIVAGVLLAVIGRTGFKRLIGWALRLVPKIGRLAGVVAMGFGGFLIYAVL